MGIKMKNSTPASNELNFIGAGTVIEGNFETKGSLRVDGRIKGIVKSGDTVTIGTTGEIEGEVYARNAIIGGRVIGDLTIEEKLVLESTSSINGNLKATKLIIDEGAIFNGKSEMSQHQMEKTGKGIFGSKTPKVATEGSVNATSAEK